MSVMNKFEASTIRYSEQDRKAYVIDSQGYEVIFPYTFMCKGPGLVVMFDMGKNLMMAVTVSAVQYLGSNYLCAVMKFWLENDLPVPAARHWQHQNYLPNVIGIEFKDKLASYTLDSIINS